MLSFLNSYNWVSFVSSSFQLINRQLSEYSPANRPKSPDNSCHIRPLSNGRLSKRKLTKNFVDILSKLSYIGIASRDYSTSLCLLNRLLVVSSPHIWGSAESLSLFFRRDRYDTHSYSC